MLGPAILQHEAGGHCKGRRMTLRRNARQDNLLLSSLAVSALCLQIHLLFRHLRRNLGSPLALTSSRCLSGGSALSVSRGSNSLSILPRPSRNTGNNITATLPNPGKLPKTFKRGISNEPRRPLVNLQAVCVHRQAGQDTDGRRVNSAFSWVSERIKNVVVTVKVIHAANDGMFAAVLFNTETKCGEAKRSKWPDGFSMLV